jgi:predicted Zn-dependent protease
MFSDNINNVIDYALKKLETSNFDSYQLSCIDRVEALTRFANSTIHQNVSDHTYRFLFRVAKDKRVSSSSLTVLTPTSIERTISQLETSIEFVPAIPFFQGFPESTDIKTQTLSTVDNLLDEFQRADIVEAAIGEAEKIDKNVKLAGAVSITDLRFRIINSNGIDSSHRLTYNSLVINSLTEGDNKGYAKEEQRVRDPRKLNPVELSRKATELSVSTCSAKDYPAGDYEAVLSPSAVQTIMRFLSFGYIGSSFHESRSFITDQIGAQLFDEKLTLLDDPLNDNTLLASPIDGEGVNKKPFFLIEDGVPKTILYNTFMASRYLNDKDKTTGHQVIPYSDYIFGGVMPLNLILYPGDSSVPEMIEETEKGFYINRLHYTNFVNRRLGALTGLTRDGLLYIENGEVVSAAKNFRFTDNLPRFLKEVSLIGKEQETGVTTTTPATKLNSFRFTGKSKH